MAQNHAPHPRRRSPPSRPWRLPRAGGRRDGGRRDSEGPGAKERSAPRAHPPNPGRSGTNRTTVTPRQLREHPKHRKHPKQPSKRTRIPQPSAPPKACPPPDDEYGFSPESVFRNGSSTSCASGSGRRSIERAIEERSIGVGSGPFSVRVPHIPTTVGGFGLNANECKRMRTNANTIRGSVRNSVSAMVIQGSSP